MSEKNTVTEIETIYSDNRLIELILMKYNIHKSEWNRNHNEEYDESLRGFVYWLIRFSGLVEATELGKRKSLFFECPSIEE